MGRSQAFRMRKEKGPEIVVLGIMAALLASLLAVAWLKFRGNMPLRAMANLGLVLVVMPFAIWSMLRFRERARLTVDDSGLRLEAGLPRWLQGSWSLRWDEIGRVTIAESMGIVQLHKQGSLVRRTLRIREWVPENLPAAPPPRPSFWRGVEVRSTELWRALDAHGVLARPGAGRAPADFDLAGHPATHAALWVMGALVVYAAADFFLARESWVEWSPEYLLPPLTVGVLAGLVAFVSMIQAARPAKVPTAVAAITACVLALAAGVASIYGLMRVNQAFAGPLEAHPYVRNAACNVLEPVEPDLPAIEYGDAARAYWCSFPREHRHSVLVRRGLAGLYQVDLTEHARAIRAFRSGAAPRK